MRDNWQTVRLGDLCTIKGRIGFRGYTRQDLVEKGEGAITLSPSNIVDDKLNLDKCQYISWFKYDESPEIMIFEGDIIYAKTASIGKVALVKDLPEKATINPQFVVFKNIKCNRSFLYYAVRSHGFKEQVSLITNGVAIPTVSQSNLEKLHIKLPSVSEQQRIVDELDLLTGIIDKKNAQLRDLDALAQSIFYEMFGDPSESKYPVAKLSSLATGKLSYGSGASAIIFDGQTRYVRITDIQEDGRLSPDAMSPSQYDAKYLLNDGDILFARSGATVGKTYLYDSKDGNAIYAGYLIRLVPNQEIVLSEYIYHFTRSHYYRAFIASNVQAVAQPNINAQQYGNLSVCVPPISEQKVFAEKMHSLESKRDMIWSSIKDTQTLLDSRMSQYFG